MVIGIVDTHLLDIWDAWLVIHEVANSFLFFVDFNGCLKVFRVCLCHDLGVGAFLRIKMLGLSPLAKGPKSII